MVDISNTEQLESRILEKNVGTTTFGNHMYSNLWYVCHKNKICITFSPRGGCSIAFKQFLDLVGLLKDGESYNPFIHEYRCTFNHCFKPCEIQTLIDTNYTFIKFIMNPYIRAVSIYRAQESNNLSFREYLKQLVNNKCEYFTDNDKFHMYPQYINGEETVITKYIKINENETFQIKLVDETIYTLDVNKYTSSHHGVRTETTVFCGDLPRVVINENLPKSYKHFYDNEIKEMVDLYYADDIKHYEFTFDDMYKISQ